MSAVLRVAAAAFPVAGFASAEAWRARLLAAARFARDGGARLLVLPEYVTAGLFSLDPVALDPAAAPDWVRWESLWRTTVQQAAADLGLTIVGGTHLVPADQPGQWWNRALVAFADGSMEVQDKLHPTPWERTWAVAPTRRIPCFRLPGADAALVAVPICYDIEFPEAVRAAARAGAEILCLPSWTDDEAGFWRVRHCAQARCIENGVAVVHAPLVGTGDVPAFEQACGAAGICTPSDTGWPRAGLAADGGWNQPVTVLADLDLDRLRALRQGGTVHPFGDARPESAYRVEPSSG